MIKPGWFIVNIIIWWIAGFCWGETFVVRHAKDYYPRICQQNAQVPLTTTDRLALIQELARGMGRDK